MEQDILKLIGESIPTFSKGQRAIGNYILSSPEEAAFLTAARLSQKAGVSESTAVRFALELGYSGYPAMQKELQSLVLKRLEETRDQTPVLSERRSSSAFEADINRIQQTEDELEPDTLRNVVDAMIHAKRIHIVGFPGSDLLATYLAQRLSDLFGGVRLYTFLDEREACQSVIDICRGEVVVVVGCLLPRRDWQWAIRILYHVGASILLLTDDADTEWCLYAKWVLTVMRDSDERIRSLTAPMSLINALLSSIIDRQDDRICARLMRLENVQGMAKM